MSLPKRPNVCILVFNRNGELFLGERYRSPGTWQFPQGGIEPELSLEQNVLKEINEEIGVNQSSIKLIKKLNNTHQYEFQVVPDYAKGIYSGQTQTFYLVEFLGLNSEIKLDTHEPEFSAFQWATPDQVRLLADSIRLKGYQGAIEEFEEYWTTVIS